MHIKDEKLAGEPSDAAEAPRAQVIHRIPAEEALRRSEARLSQAVKAGNVGLWDWDLRTNRVYFSPEWKSQIGYDNDEISDHFFEWQSRLHPEDIESTVEAARAFIENRRSEYSREFRFRHKDGSYRWIWAQGSLLYDAQGRPERMLGSHVDITEHKLVEEALRVSRDELESRVRQRTADLARINESLVAEVTERKHAEAALQDSARQLREQLHQIDELYKYSPVGLYAVDRELRFLRVNNRLAEIDGKSVEEHLGHAVSEVVPNLAEQLKRLWQPVLEQGVPVLDVEVSGTTARAPGVQRYWLCNYFPTTSATGELTGLMAAVVEITERKRMEEALRNSEIRYRAMVQNFPGMLYTGRPDWTVDIASGAESLSGYTNDELNSLQGGWLALVHPEDRERVMTTSEPIVREPGVIIQIYRIVTRTGPVKWVEDRKVLIFSERGEFQGVEGLVLDITDRKLAEEALREQTQRYELVILGTRDAIWDWDVVNRRVLYSPQWKHIRGHDEHEITDREEEWSSGIHPEDAPRVLAALQAHFEGRTDVFSEEYRVRCKDGSWKWVLDRGIVRRDESGRVIRMAGSETDITERKWAEEERNQLQAQLQQAQKLDAVGRLSGGVAHDFNNLLTVIQGNVEIAAMSLEEGFGEPNRAEVAAALQEIEQAAMRASNLTSQLLTFSRKHVTHVQLLDMDTVLQETQKLLRRLVREDIAFEIVRDPGQHLIRADKTEIEQVLMNLAVNAGDAMPEGGTLTIRLSNATLDPADARKHPGSAAGPHVLITVTDTGTGMDARTLEHLFEPFFTTKPYGKGTGLGLSIVYGIVKKAGGHITVDSRPGEGSTFKLYIPAARREYPEPMKPTSTQWQRGDETILLCEDDAALRRLAAAVLTAAGYTVIEADNGEQAVRLAKDNAGAFQLLITDVVMPGMKGDKVAEAILKDQAGVQVLFMSGYASDVLNAEGIAKRGMQFLQKPFKPDILLQRVRESLGNPGK